MQSMTTEQKIKALLHELNQQQYAYKNVSYGPADFQPVNIPMLVIVALWAWWWLRKEGLL